MYARVTLAAACTPPESEKRSIVRPNIKLKNINKALLLFIGYNKINRMYG